MGNARCIESGAGTHRGTEKQGREEDAKEDFFPLCYLFAESQVHKLEK